jgi:hypothetical protein
VFTQAGKLYRHHLSSEGDRWRIFLTFATQYLSIVASLLVAYHEFAFDDTRFITGPFDEVNVRWYQHVGSGIGLLLVLQIFLPHI